jgi:Leucine-rich repeat (LRR) protein
MLFLNGNQISVVQFYLPPSLTYINLSKNKIKILPPGMFINMSLIGTLYINDNDIPELRSLKQLSVVFWTDSKCVSM